MNRKLFFFNVVLLVVLLFAVWGCEGDVSTVSEDPYGPVEDAAVSFGVKWPEASGEQAFRSMTASLTDMSAECATRGVDKVRVDVKSQEEATLKSATFDCAAGQGSLTGIEPQSGCAIVVTALNDNGVAVYRGQKTGVTLYAGMNNVGTIQMEFIDVNILQHGGKLFALTANTYPDTSDWDQAVRDEFGFAWKVAEWNDLKKIFGNSIAESRLLAEFIDQSHPDRNGGSAYVTRNGSRQYSNNRYYFASAHYQDLPGHYLAHDNIRNYMVSLGSWWGGTKIMAMRDADGSSNDSTDPSSASDHIYILSVSPDSDLVDGIYQNFVVEVEYALQSEAHGELMIGFNREELTTFHITIEVSELVNRGSGIHTFYVNTLTRDWGSEGDFSVYVNLSPYPREHGQSWTPLATDRRKLDFH